jgi:glycosyltransferase involved in cell wall biosynthesis
MPAVAFPVGVGGESPIRLSVVIPTHNRPALLQQAIQSAVVQRHRSAEIIVVDDGSTPAVDVLDVRAGYALPITLLRNDQAQGPSMARNRGIAAARGDILTFLDDDDLLAPNALAIIDGYFLENNGVDALFLSVEPFGPFAGGVRDNQDKALRKVLSRPGVVFGSDTEFSRLQSEELFISLLDTMPITFQRVAIRREALLAVGNYRGSGFEDLEWYYRIALQLRCALVRLPLCQFRCDQQSYFSTGEAKARLSDTVVSVREQLLKIQEVQANPRIAAAVRASLAVAHFNKAFHSLHDDRNGGFSWDSFRASLRNGVSWNHVSLALRALFRLQGR